MTESSGGNEVKPWQQPKEHDNRSSHESRRPSNSFGKIFAVVFVAAFIGAFAGVNLGGISSTGLFIGDTETPEAPSPTITPPTNNPPQANPTVSLAALEDDDPVKGDANAPVTIIEFSDFQCPFCGRFYSSSLPQIQQKYIDTGKVRLVYRDFPLSFHPNAQPAAEAAACAEEQGKFWEFHDKIFENQDSMGTDSYKAWADELGLNTGQFNSCIDSGKYRQEVQADFASGQQAGVSGTPSFFIGKSGGKGQKIVGAQPFSVFEAAIESYL